MSESLQYDNLGTVSTYVENEYKKWEEKYIIPFGDEFNIRLLLQLRYDILTTKPEYTKTKLELIEMVNRIQSRLKLKPKVVEQIPMYIDFICTKGNKERDKAIIYLNGNMYILQGNNYKSIADYANAINIIAKEVNAVIYIDVQGFGIGIYDELKQYKDLAVKKLNFYNGHFSL